jgi:hypothetical protein
MADIFNLLQNGKAVRKNEIVESLSPPTDFLQYIQKFFPEEIYNLNENSVLYKLLYSILGEAGVLGLKKNFFAPRLYSTLNGTNFNDIDTLFSDLFRLRRSQKELYDYDPYGQLLTEQQWSAIKYKDSSFKLRAQDYMRYFQFGNTYDGIKILARSGSGYESYVQENWKYLDDVVSDEPIGIPNFGKTNAYEEIVIIPQTSIGLSIEEQRRVTSVMHRLAPCNGIVSVVDGEDLVTEISFDKENMNSTSNYFYVDRKVTGGNLIDYSYSSTNNWISPSEEKSAPYAAFENRSETIETISPNLITASTYHSGVFSNEQRNLFEHLNEIDEKTIFSYVADQALPSSFKNNTLTSPWMYRPSTNKSIYTVDTFYPVGYFADQNLNPDNKLYWASEELYPDVIDSLEVDFLNKKPINSIEFEVSQKPVDIKIYYWKLDTELDEYYWEEVVYRDDIENNLSIFYRGSSNYSWQYVNPYFETVETSKLKIDFERRMDPFPYSFSPTIEWSIEVRNLRFLHVIAKIEDFVPINNIDVLGNSYRTVLNEYSLENALKNKINRYWKSQVNPSRFAVEAIYFDISDNGDPSLIDEIYLDPLTSGCIVHVYYTDDDSTSDWDNKLWSPIPRHYVLGKGNINLPNTIQAKYIKIEFTNLSTVAYNFPNTKESVRYRLYPTWVEQMAKQFAPITDSPLRSNEAYSIVDPSFLNMGVVTPEKDKLTPEVPKSVLDFIEANVQSTVLNEYQVWKNPELQADSSINLDRTINIYPNSVDNLYSKSLLSTIKINDRGGATENLLNSTDPSSWNVELPLTPKELVNLASRNDRTLVEEEKTWPDMWFMQKCRHGYKVVESPRTDKVGYYVGIKDVKFYKRDKTKQFDDFNYLINLSDDSFIEKNEFDLNEWRWTLSTSTLIDAGSNNVINYASENFDGVAF